MNQGRQIRDSTEAAEFQAALDVLAEGGWSLGVDDLGYVDTEAARAERRAFEIVWCMAVEYEIVRSTKILGALSEVLRTSSRPPRG